MNPLKQLQLTRSLAAADAAWAAAREKANADLIASMRQIVAQALAGEPEVPQVPQLTPKDPEAA